MSRYGMDCWEREGIPELSLIKVDDMISFLEIKVGNRFRAKTTLHRMLAHRTRLRIVKKWSDAALEQEKWDQSTREFMNIFPTFKEDHYNHELILEIDDLHSRLIKVEPDIPKEDLAQSIRENRYRTS